MRWVLDDARSLAAGAGLETCFETGRGGGRHGWASGRRHGRTPITLEGVERVTTVDLQGYWEGLRYTDVYFHYSGWVEPRVLLGYGVARQFHRLLVAAGRLILPES